MGRFAACGWRVGVLADRVTCPAAACILSPAIYARRFLPTRGSILIANILLPMAAGRACEVSFNQAFLLADRLRARLVLVAASSATTQPGEDLGVEMPGMDKSPVERAVPEEELWPVSGEGHAELPDFAVNAAQRCQEMRIGCLIRVAYGRLASHAREVSQLCDLAVLPRPTSAAAMTQREALNLALTSQCPCLFSALDVVEPRRAVAWYDGKPPSARSLRTVAELVALLNLRLTVILTAPNRSRAHELGRQVEVVASGYHIECTTQILVGGKASEVAAVADESGAHIVAAPAVRPFVKAALERSSIMSLVTP